MAEGSRTPPRSGAQAVHRAMAVLRCIETTPDTVSVTEIAQQTGLTVSTAHRLARALTDGGLLSQDQRSERYQLGPTLVVLGRKAEGRLGFGDALPALRELSRSTGESVNLGMRAGSEVHVILDVASDQPLRFDQASGTRVPVHTSAMGKCLLAYADDVDATLDGVGDLVKVTDRTITDRTRLRAELELVRERGWALNDEERNPGVRAIAVPVLGHDDQVLAAIALQGPTIRVTHESLDTLAASLQRTASQIVPLLVGRAGGA